MLFLTNNLKYLPQNTSGISYCSNKYTAFHYNNTLIQSYRLIYNKAVSVIWSSNFHCNERHCCLNKVCFYSLKSSICLFEVFFFFSVHHAFFRVFLNANDWTEHVNDIGLHHFYLIPQILGQCFYSISL